MPHFTKEEFPKRILEINDDAQAAAFLATVDNLAELLNTRNEHDENVLHRAVNSH